MPRPEPLSDIAVAFIVREKFSWALASLRRLYALAGAPFTLYLVDSVYPARVRAEIDAFLADQTNVVRVEAGRFLFANEAISLVLRRATEPLLLVLQNDVLIARDLLKRLRESLSAVKCDVVVPLLLDIGSGHFETHRDTGDPKGLVEEDGQVFVERTVPAESVLGRSRVYQIENHCLLARADALRQLRLSPRLNTREHIDLSVALWKSGRTVFRDNAAEALFVDSPPVPLHDFDCDFYRFRWDLAAARRSNEEVRLKWRVAGMSDSLPFVERQQQALDPGAVLRGRSPASEIDPWPETFSGNDPTIDIVVITYRSDEHLKRLEQDLAACTTGRYRLFVHDNFGVQRNFSALQNELAAQGSGEYLLFLNPDVALTPGWDARLIGFLETHPRGAAAVPLPVGDERFLKFWEPHVPPQWKSVRWPPSEEQMTELARAVEGNRGYYVFDHIDFFCAHFAFLIRRRTFDSMHGFDERLRFFGGDREITWRLRSALGLEVLGPQHCALFHAGGASTEAAKASAELDPKREWQHRNRVLSALSSGKFKPWHQLDAAERAAVRADPRYASIGGPLDEGPEIADPLPG
jgi:hypothetical protein